ncbi:imidazolonepropionase-like amidohydrolase [Flavobacterium sp. CG_23.5]|nr:imidazolonepropionase-like amidohydrolase [Flavobacterium sp. CG_9.10]MBP2284358.1 imidazolonepropionase-like amidohydrolase [Flavobacterium sp. CG_23.5]
MIDVLSGKVLTNQIILIDSSRIITIGSDITILKNIEITDLRNATVLPGLMDCHTYSHLCEANIIFRFHNGLFSILLLLVSYCSLRV